MKIIAAYVLFGSTRRYLESIAIALIVAGALFAVVGCSQPAGTTSTRSFDGSFKSPLTGSTVKIKSNSSTTIPDKEQETK